MNFTLYTARTVGSKANCVYPDRRDINSADDLAAAVKFDHVCAEYQKNYRREEHFITSDVLVMDCDNDHSEDPPDWITPAKLDELLPDVAFACAPSRHNNLPKGDLSARPRFHAYFPIDPVTDPKRYAALKQKLYEAYPFFDGNALDAARFLFGTHGAGTPGTGEITWHDRWYYIDGMFPVEEEEEKAVPAPAAAKDADKKAAPAADADQAKAGKLENRKPRNNKIPEGLRNTTLSHSALRYLKRFGEGEKAEQLFQEEAERCDPPLEDDELNAIWNSAVKGFRKKVASQADYVSPEEYEKDFDPAADPDDPLHLKPEDYSDIGQARILKREFGDELLYTRETEWLRFDGQQWRESDQLAVAAETELTDMQLLEAKRRKEQAENWLAELGATGKSLTKLMLDPQKGEDVKHAAAMEKGAEKYLDFVEKRRNMSFVNATLEAAESMLFASINDMDTDPFLLNTPGCTYDLHLGLAGGHEPRAEDRITKTARNAPGTQGAEIWQNALNTFFCGNAALIDYVQQIIGLVAIGKVYQEAMIIAYGDGRNGKSTFWNTIRRVLGDYSASLPAEIITAAKTGINVQAQLAEIKGARLVIAAELEEGLRLSTSMVKQLCSTDEINACEKYKKPFDFVPSHTLVLYTNHLPKVGAMDEGTWRRLIVIPFTAKLEAGGEVLNYTDYLLENAAPAVMQWIIEGAEKVIQLKFHPVMPDCVKAACDEYRDNNNWLNAFLEECCDVGQGYTAKSGELYTAYRVFCNRTGDFTRSTTDFYGALEQAGFERKKTNKGNLIVGLSLKSDFSE